MPRLVVAGRVAPLLHTPCTPLDGDTTQDTSVGVLVCVCGVGPVQSHRQTHLAPVLVHTWSCRHQAHTNTLLLTETPPPDTIAASGVRDTRHQNLA